MYPPATQHARDDEGRDAEPEVEGEATDGDGRDAAPPARLLQVKIVIYFNATLRMQLQPVFRCSSLNALDPGSGREIPAIWHDTGVWHGRFTPES